VNERGCKNGVGASLGAESKLDLAAKKRFQKNFDCDKQFGRPMASSENGLFQLNLGARQISAFHPHSNFREDDRIQFFTVPKPLMLKLNKYATPNQKHK